MINDYLQIKSFFLEHQRMPSYEELKIILDVASNNTVSYRLKKLINGGFLTKEKGYLKFKGLKVELIEE